MAKVALLNIQKSFGPVRVIRDLTLEIADGELVCLLGPSGSGKTTLLRMIAGLETLDSGEIWVGDQEVSGLEPRDRHVGMMFQGYALYPHLSIRENLAYPLRVRHVPRDEVDQRVTEVARLLGIEELLHRRIHQVSGGQQQRVAIGRAIVQKPSVYLLDEPISNLDASLRESVRAEIRRLQQALRATMIVVTHDQLDALALADRIALLSANGVLQQYGPPREIYDEPANAFVASFIGRSRMNLLSCRFAADGRGHLQGRGFQLPVSPAAAGLLRVRGASEVTVGIRPEEIVICDSEREGALRAVVELVNFQGDQALCDVRLGEEMIRVTLAGGARVAAGQRIWLVPRGDRLHLFDRQTGMRFDHVPRG
jgi:multiple sugar transport system ATP-binding protein